MSRTYGARRAWAGLAVLCAGSSYGMVTPLVKLALAHGVTVPQMTAAQYAFPAALLWVVALGQHAVAPISRAGLIRLIAIGVSASLTSIFYYLALSALPAALAVVLLFQFSWMVMGIDFLVAKQVPTWGELLAVALVLGGTFLATGFLSSGMHTLPVSGILAGLLAALTYACLIYFNSHFETPLSASFRAAVSSTAALATVFLVYSEPYRLALIPTRIASWAWVSLSGTFSQAIPVWLLSLAVPVVGGTLASILASIELPVAVVLSAWWLGERLSGSEWLGVGIILLGVLWGPLSATYLTKRKEPRRAPDSP